MKLSNLLLSLSVALSLAACGGSAAPAPAAPAPAAPAVTEPASVEPPAKEKTAQPDYATMSDDELGEAAIVMMQAMADSTAELQGDCDAQADGLQAIVDANKDLMAAMKTADADPAKKKHFEDNFGQRAVEVMGAMMPNLADCQDNVKLQQVFSSFE